MGREQVTPLTPVAVDALRAARTHAPGIADAPVFPPGGLTGHSARSRWRRWWLHGEQLAGLSHEARFGWHSLRHAFATALRSQPDVDVAALGGWKSTVTLKVCYQHPEMNRMRQALRQLRTESTNGEQAPDKTRRGTFVQKHAHWGRRCGLSAHAIAPDVLLRLPFPRQFDLSA